MRICKGIYLEPAAIAFTDARGDPRQLPPLPRRAVRRAAAYVGIATHDEWLIGESLARVSQRGLGREEYELQMLLGVREERRDELVAEGHRLRVYVPYGEQWYEYSVRRLQENPAMAGTIARRPRGACSAGIADGRSSAAPVFRRPRSCVRLVPRRRSYDGCAVGRADPAHSRVSRDGGRLRVHVG